MTLAKWAGVKYLVTYKLRNKSRLLQLKISIYTFINYDDEGGVVIPSKSRRNMGISKNDFVEFFISGEQIVLKKYEPACFFCGDKTNVQEYRGKSVCGECFCYYRPYSIENKKGR